MCDTFLESGRAQKLKGTMKYPHKNLESWNLGKEQIDLSIWNMCDTFLESGRAQKLKGTMESPT